MKLPRRTCTPLAQMLSLTAKGTPARGPRGRPSRASASICSARSRADLSRTVINAPREAFCAWMRSRNPCTTSTAGVSWETTPSLIRLIEAMPRHCNARERVRGARRAVRSRGAWQSRAVLIGPAVEFAPGRGGATDPLHCSGASRPHDEHGIGFAITQRYIMVYRVMITLVLSSRRFLVRSPRIPIRPAGQRPAASHDCAAPACSWVLRLHCA